MVCFGVSVGSLSAAAGVCFCLVCCLGEVSCAGCCWTWDTGGDLCGSSHKLALLELGPLWQFRVLDSEVPFQRLKPDPGWGTKIAQVVCYGMKGH